MQVGAIYKLLSLEEGIHWLSMSFRPFRFILLSPLIFRRLSSMLLCSVWPIFLGFGWWREALPLGVIGEALSGVKWRWLGCAITASHTNQRLYEALVRVFEERISLECFHAGAILWRVLYSARLLLHMEANGRSCWGCRIEYLWSSRLPLLGSIDVWKLFPILSVRFGSTTCGRATLM